MTEENKTVAPVPGTPEYDAAMIAKAETGGVIASHTDAAGNVETLEVAPPPAPPVAPTEEPALILGKFKTQADLEAAYKALEGKLGEPKPPEAVKPPEPKLDAEGKPVVETPPPAPEAPALAALSDKATAELTSDGKMSDETYAGFEKAGISRAQLDTYVEGQKALSMVRVQNVQAEVGGAEAYREMLAWAGTGLTPAEQVAFDHAVLGADDGVRLMAVKGLQARYVAENGKGGKLVQTTTSSAALTGEIFKSRAEMTTAMKDARYAKDDGYRAEVSRKVANTANAGIDLWG